MPEAEGRRPRRIALDGPAAAGKTTVGRLLAQRLGMRWLDTGILYRAVTAAALEAGLAPEDEAALMGLLARRPLRVVPLAAAAPWTSLSHSAEPIWIGPCATLPSTPTCPP